MAKRRGFSLVELMVTITIIAILTSIGTVIFYRAQAGARDGRRKADLEAIKTALEIYYAEYQAYPSTGGAWWGICVNGGSRATSGASAYVPGLTPTYMSLLPVDPLERTDGWSGYLYRSDGTNYKLLAHATGPESFPSAGRPLYDPVRPTWAWMLCSAEPACSSW